MLNCLMIEQIESCPDTTITLLNGKKIVVKDTEKEVVKCTIDFYKKIGLVASLQEVGDANE